MWNWKKRKTITRSSFDFEERLPILSVVCDSYSFLFFVLEKLKSLYKQLTCVEFSSNAPVVVVGSADGTVGCYRVKGLDILPLSDQEQLSRLEKSMFDAVGMDGDGAP